ncbi:anamorsin protein [Trifolium repens]|nr:anamorsin protein [Trifolium repens]
MGKTDGGGLTATVAILDDGGVDRRKHSDDIPQLAEDGKFNSRLFCYYWLNFRKYRLYIVIKAKKPSWKIGSSFALKKKVVKSSPKVQIDFDSDLIDENSLLSEEDLKKPVLPYGK